MGRAISEEKIRRAAALRANGASWVQAGRMVGHSCDGVRSALDPDYRAARQAAMRKRKRGGAQVVAPCWEHIGMRAVPAEVIAERDRRAALELTLNQALLGDPLPGRVWPDGRRAP